MSEDQLSAKERSDLNRYHMLLRCALRSVSLCSNELQLLWDALRDTVIDASTARQLPHDIMTSIRHRRLDEKWHVDMTLLCRKLAMYNDLQRMAIIDALEQLDNISDEGTGEVATLSLTSVGLIRNLSNTMVDMPNIALWVLRTNELPVSHRHLARPDQTFFDIRELIAPDFLVYARAGWAHWDANQEQWLQTEWESLTKKYPLLPSQAVQRARLTVGCDAKQVQAELVSCACHVVTPRSTYYLPDGTALVARWDGGSVWWFDVIDASELVITVEKITGVLWAERREELGMGSLRRWRGGLFTFFDLATSIAAIHTPTE